MEFAKIRLQTADTRSLLKFLHTQFRTHGFRRGFYHGFTVTLVREVPGYSAYFWTYEYLCRWMKPTHAELSIPEQLVAGGIAGMVAWLNVPCDVVKTRVQEDLEKRSAWFWLRTTWRQEGHRGMWLGFLSTMIRAFPVNAAIFFSYRSCFELLQGQQIT